MDVLGLFMALGILLIPFSVAHWSFSKLRKRGFKYPELAGLGIFVITFCSIGAAYMVCAMVAFSR